MGPFRFVCDRTFYHVLAKGHVLPNVVQAAHKLGIISLSHVLSTGHEFELIPFEYTTSARMNIIGLT